MSSTFLLVFFRNPNYPSAVPSTWSQYNSTSQTYLVLNKDMKEQSEKQLLAARATDFWLDVVPSLLVGKTEDNTNCTRTSATARSMVSGILISALVVTSLLLKCEL